MLLLNNIIYHVYITLFSGSANQSIKVLNIKGETLSHIRYHDGFIGQRIGPLSCLAFHPYWVRYCVLLYQFIDLFYLDKFSSLFNYYELLLTRQDCLPCETPKNGPMKLAVISNFYHWKALRGHRTRYLLILSSTPQLIGHESFLSKIVLLYFTDCRGFF